MKIQKTIYQLILDKSGSMYDCIDNTINGFNEQVERILRLESDFKEQQISMGLTIFNDQVVNRFSDMPAREVQKLTTKTYQPQGGTALLDAIGITVQRIENEIHASESVRDTTVVVVILTDGYENSSRLFSLAEIRNMISRLEETGKWTFSFIGATLDAMDVAESMAIKKQNSYSFQKEGMVEEVWDKLSSSMDNYMIKKRAGKDLGNLFEE